MSELRANGGVLGRIIQFTEQLFPKRFRRDQIIVPVVRLTGVIGSATPLRPGLSLAVVAKLLDRAFATKGARAVALSINSPGGSPVQSRQIWLRIRQLAAEKNLPVLVFVEDVAASGGYMLACAGDEIYCDPSSIVGSIGVVGGTFGFTELMRKVGIERRLYTSGDNKAMLDPFSPEDLDDVARLKALQREIHRVFIDLVKDARGARLKHLENDLFNGDIWTGQRAVELGLCDGLQDLRSTLKARFGDSVKMPLVSQPGGLLSGLFGRKSATTSLGLGVNTLDELPEQVISALESRAIWARFGF